jgi:hypothetical protein
MGNSAYHWPTKLCRKVAARDLGRLPIYIVPQTLLPDELGGRSVCHGYTASRLDLHLRDHIPGYRGRGPCMVINDRHLRTAYDPADFDYTFTATVLHELAHILQRPWLYNEPVTEPPERIQLEAQQVADIVSNEKPAGLPFKGHGAQFIRVALHLQYRAETLATWIAPYDLCAGCRYRLSHARRYQLALGDEPKRMARKAIAEIVASEAPPKFVQLWADDVHAHFQSLSRFEGASS